MDRHEAQILADLEQELLAPAVRRLRRRFWSATALVLAGTAVGLLVVGLAVLPILYGGLVIGGLLLVAQTTDRPAPPPVTRVRRSTTRPRRQPLGCSTKS